MPAQSITDIPSPRSFPSGTDFSVNGQFTFVALNSSGQLASPSAGGSALGILQDKPKVGDPGSVCRPGDISLLLLSGTVAAGGAIATAADGSGIPIVTGDYYLAIALQAGQTGQVIPVVFQGKGSHL